MCMLCIAVIEIAHRRTYMYNDFGSRPLEAVAGEAAVQVSLLRRGMMDGF